MTTYYNSPKTKKFFYELESLRGIAALIVVLFHIPWLNFFYENSLIRNGYLMVYLFFILSGFVITHNYLIRINSPKDFYQFIVLRTGRIYPLHLVFLMVFLFYEVIKYLSVQFLGFYNPTSPFEINNLTNFIYNLFLIHSFGFSESSFNGPSWSISAEFYTYIFFGIITLFYKQIFIYLCSIIAFISVTILCFTNYSSGLLLCITGFFIGSVTYKIYERLSTFKFKYYTHLLSITFFVIACYICFKIPFKHDITSFFIFPFLILFIALSPDHPISKILNIKVFRWLGKISYSIYMSHASILWVFTQFLKVVLKIPFTSIDKDLVIQTSYGVGSIALILALITIISISHFSYKYIEDYYRRRAKDIFITKK